MGYSDRPPSTLLHNTSCSMTWELLAPLLLLWVSVGEGGGREGGRHLQHHEMKLLGIVCGGGGVTSTPCQGREGGREGRGGEGRGGEGRGGEGRGGEGKEGREGGREGGDRRGRDGRG